MTPFVIATLVTLMIFAGIALRIMTPEERARLAETVLAHIRRAIRATKGSSANEPFNEFLRARTGYTVVTPALIALNVAIFVLMLFGDGAIADPQTLIGWGANFAPRTTNGEWWRLIAAMFVHSGLLHLLVTIAALVPLGLMLERAVGPVALAAVYVAAGILANVISLWTSPALSVTSGASGAVFGIYGLTLASLIWGIIGRPDVSIPLTTMKRIGAAAAVFFLYNLITDDLGVMSELAGFTTGIVGGLLMTRSVARDRAPVRRAALVMAVSVALAIVCAVPVRGVVDVTSEIALVIGVEERTAGAYDAATAQFRRGTIGADALAQLIDQTIMPELQATHARIKGLHGVPREHAALVGAAEEYLQLREQSWQRRSDALLKSNMRRLRDADRTEQAALEAFERMKAAG